MSGEPTGLRFTVYLDGERADEGWVYTGDATDDATIARLSGLCERASEAGVPWRLEVYDPDEPIGRGNPLQVDPGSFPVAAVRITVSLAPPGFRRFYANPN